MPPARRGQGVCKAGFHKVRKTRLVCAKIGGRVCRSGVRLENGKCKRMALTEAQKDRKRRLAKAYRMGERIKQKRMNSNAGLVLRAIKKAGRRARRERMGTVAPSAAPSRKYNLRSSRLP